VLVAWRRDVALENGASSVAAMRRTVPPVLLASILVLSLAACGSEGDTSSDATQSSTATGSDPATDSSTATGSDPAVESVPAEGSDPAAGSSDPAATVDAATPPSPSADKPEVAIPDEIPTELQVTVLEEGTGPPAETGDTVIVDYVGVRSSDGVEFDNSYDSGQPFPVALGTKSVIAGWEEGLVGAQSGARLQLDIPSDLAYGAEARGDVIGENEALTFVVDVRAVIPATDPADAPTEPGVPPSVGATEVTTVDLVEGDGATAEAGQTAVLHLVLFRGDNGVQLDSTWDAEPINAPLSEGTFPGLVEGLEGMKVGGRRAITIPPDKGFGAEGSPTIGLPANTDLIMVVDLLGVY